MLFPLWPLILSTYDFYAPFWPNYKFVLVSCKISGFSNFHVLHLNYEKFKIFLQNTLNMSKTARVYFRVLEKGTIIKLKTLITNPKFITPIL